MSDHNRFSQPQGLPLPTRRTGKEKPIATLEEAIEIEPQIGILLDQAGRERNATCNTYDAYKQQMLLLAGWYAKCPRLATEEVFGMVMDALIDRLEY